MKNFLKTNKIQNYKKVFLFKNKIDNGIINYSIISNCLENFFAEIMNPLNNNQFITFQLVYKLSDNTFRSLGYLNKINKNDLNNLKNSLLLFYENDFNDYGEDFFNKVNLIIIKYRYLDMSKNENKSVIMNIANKNKMIPTHLANKKTIPSLYNTEKWGTIENKYEFNNINKYSIIRGNYRYEINQTLSSRNVEIFSSNNKLIIQFIDKFIDDNSFIRTIKDTDFYFKNDKLIIKIKNKETKFFKKSKIDSIINENIITLDLETFSSIINDDEVLQVLSCCIYDGTNKLTFYLSDYNSSEDLLRDAIKSLMKENYNNYKVYIHNLSSFDGIFLLKILATMDNSKLIPIIKDDKMIALTLKFGKNKITFHDSMLLLPSSLEKLSKSFNVNNKKIIFPIKWLINNPEFNLYYKGFVPNIHYFQNITIQEYNNYILERNNVWDFKKELLNYNMIDCIALYEILLKFNTLIFNKFSLNVFNYPTLPSLAMGIYRSSFLKNYKIPIIGGKMLHDIKLSYTGGATEMYIPYGENLYHYDINSLYPSSMFKFNMPVGNIKYFVGDILKIENNPFGFFKVKVMSPNYLDNPILQIRHNNKTISPLGKWEGWYFSEELFNAEKYGYKFEILEGYLFEKENIFHDYVSVLHEIKQNSEKSSPLYLIAKLLLNSLYGKFGMTDDLATHIIVDLNKLDKLIDSKDRIKTIELNENLILVSYHDKNEDKFIDDYTSSDISVGIAAAITSYSRIKMSQFKNLPDNKMYYTDTDSAVMQYPLPNYKIGNHLGQMVLEKTYTEFIALAPKVYGGILTDGKEITKVKGFKNKISFANLKSLLEENKSLKLNHKKWFRSINESSIKIKSQVYTLIPTANKRELIYKNNKLISTKAYILKHPSCNNKISNSLKIKKVFKK